MLVLDRSVGEAIVIQLPDGRTVRVVLDFITRHWRLARIGIEAPQDISILRGELVGREQRKEGEP